MAGVVAVLLAALIGLCLLAVAALKGRLRRVLEGYPNEGALISAFRRAEAGSWWARRFQGESEMTIRKRGAFLGGPTSSPHIRRSPAAPGSHPTSE